MKKYILFMLFPFLFSMSSFAQKNIVKVGFVAPEFALENEVHRTGILKDNFCNIHY